MKLRIDFFYIFSIVLFASFLIRTAAPFFKYLNFILLPVHVIVTIVFFINYRPRINIIFYIEKYWALLIIVLMFIGYFIFTGFGFVLMYNEFYNVLFILYITIIFYLFFYNYKSSVFNKILDYLFIIISILVGFSFLKFFDKFLLDSNLSSFVYDLSADGTSLVADHNFFALIILLGLLLLFLKVKSTHSKSGTFYLNLLYLAYVVIIVFSTSRRAVFTILIIHFLIYIGALFNLYLFRKIFRKLLLGQAMLFMALCFIIFFMFFASSNSRNVLTNQLGLKNKNFKTYLTTLTYDYSTLLGNNYNIKFWERYLWDSETKTNRLFVENWGHKKHTVQFPLNSKDSLLALTEGYKLDSTANAFPYQRENAESYTYLPTFKAKKGNKYKIIIYCYLSEDFNAERIQLIANGKNEVTESKYYWIGIDKPDKKLKNRWQKLEITFTGKGGRVLSKVNFIKYHENDFSNLNGYIVFAAPLIRDFSTNIPENKIYSIKEWNSTRDKQTDSFERFLYRFLYNKIKGNQNVCTNEYKNSLQNLIRLQPSNPANYLLSQKIIDSCNTKIDNSSNTSSQQDFKKNVALKDIFYKKIVKKLLNVEKDSVGEKKSSKSHYEENDPNAQSEYALVKGRYEFMRYAWNLFKQKTWKEKLFGSGFGYLRKYGEKFRDDPNNPTYPHNPFISHLLFSGIFGLVILCIFLVTVIKEYIKHRKQLATYFVFFLITFFFALFSGNTYFSVPILVGLSILPYIYKNTDNEQDTDNRSKQLHRE